MNQRSLIITATEMSQAFYRSTFQRYEIVAPNIYFENHNTEMDIMAIRKSGYIDEIEIKLTRTDFLADFKKETRRCIREPRFEVVFENKHERICAGEMSCNRFSFFMPEELAKQCEIPEYAGLYVFRKIDGRRPHIREIKKAPLLHKRKINDRQKCNLLRKMCFRYWDLAK